MFAPGPLEILIVAAIVLLLFGKRVPGVMHSLGKSIVEFKRGVRGVEADETPPAESTAEKRDRTTMGPL